MKLSSRQRTSGCVEPAGKDGERGELGVAWDAEETILQRGHPGLGEYDMGVVQPTTQLKTSNYPTHVTSQPLSTTAMASPIIQLFDDFRADLDDYNDRRERLIKVHLLPSPLQASI